MANFQQHRSFWVTFFLTTTFKPPINCGDDIQVKDKKIVKIEVVKDFTLWPQANQQGQDHQLFPEQYESI